MSFDLSAQLQDVENNSATLQPETTQPVSQPSKRAALIQARRSAIAQIHKKGSKAPGKKKKVLLLPLPLATLLTLRLVKASESGGEEGRKEATRWC